MGDYTSAERQRRYIQRLKAGAATNVSTVTNGEQRIKTLEQRVAELEADNERLRSQKAPTVSDASIDPATLSMSAQKKLETAIRQEKRRLEESWQQALSEKISEHIEAVLVGIYQQKLDDADFVIKSRRGLMKRETYRLIASCLHPDQSASKEKLHRAFVAFTKLELVFLDEKEMPTSPAAPIPRTAAEWTAMREAAKAMRKQHRSNGMQRR
jgi:hypothetical protein